jgi:hypothetical protein
MAIIQIQIDKKTIDDVLLDGGFGVNIIIEQLKTRLGLLKPKPIPYNLQMVNQNTTKLIGLIKDLRIYVHNIPYIATCIILQDTVVIFNYSMLLGRPWLKDVKIAHD